MTDPDDLLARASTWIAPVTVATAVAVGLTSGLGPAILVLAGGILLGAVLLFWSSLGRLTGESPLTLEEAVGLAAPSPEEERKRSILRALKDLEYERSVGKISEEDFAELTTRYRAEAKVLLQSLDAELEPARKAAEKKLEKRLRAEKVDRPKDRGTGRETAPAKTAGEAASTDSPATENTSEAAAPADSPAPATAPTAPACAACGTKNDSDARFCKKCGAALAAEGATP
ncbi:MAG TPA: zinc-ribbon domain-containing protein [Polyangiaceae bacterium]|nr:zinc-ribbon domain-containing protein [Polyangiaceae bacterium]